MRYFAASLAQVPRQHRVCLKAVSIGGLNWLGSGRRTDIKIRCRPTGAAEAAKVARIHLDDKRRGSCEDCWLEGDLKFEVSCDSDDLEVPPGVMLCLIFYAIAKTIRGMAALRTALSLLLQSSGAADRDQRKLMSFSACMLAVYICVWICTACDWLLVAQCSWASISLMHQLPWAQVLRVRDKRPARVLFSAWLHSAYFEIPVVQLKRADLDKVGGQTPV